MNHERNRQTDRQDYYGNTALGSASTEPIEVPFGMWTRVGPRKHALDGRSHWHNLANTIEPSMTGGDADSLSDYFNHLLVHGQVTIIFVVSVGLSVCLFVCLFVQSFSQPSLIRFRSN